MRTIRTLLAPLLILGVLLSLPASASATVATDYKGWGYVSPNAPAAYHACADCDLYVTAWQWIYPANEGGQGYWKKTSLQVDTAVYIQHFSGNWMWAWSPAKGWLAAKDVVLDPVTTVASTTAFDKVTPWGTALVVTGTSKTADGKNIDGVDISIKNATGTITKLEPGMNAGTFSAYRLNLTPGNYTVQACSTTAGKHNTVRTRYSNSCTGWKTFTIAAPVVIVTTKTTIAWVNPKRGPNGYVDLGGTVTASDGKKLDGTIVLTYKKTGKTVTHNAAVVGGAYTSHNLISYGDWTVRACFQESSPTATLKIYGSCSGLKSFTRIP